MSNVDIQIAAVTERQHQRNKPSIRPVLTPVGPSISYVELTQGQWALIDANDVSAVGDHNWSASWNKITGSFYAVRKLYREDGSTTSIGMHVALLRPASGYVVDHKNYNSLDNRRSANLRAATRAQNAYNVGITAANKSGYKGVSWDKRRSKYRAEMNVNGKNTFLGYRDSAFEANELYCKAADELHGEFRRVA
jgi:hypothetical protein